MKSTQSLYRYAERTRIEVINYPLPETASMSIDVGNGYIGMDYTRLETEADERVHLAHELGHCTTGAFYNRYARLDIRQRHENRADKWAIRRLISQEALDDAVAEGHIELWDLADFFGVTEEFMKKTICLYVNGNIASEIYF